MLAIAVLLAASVRVTVAVDRLDTGPLVIDGALRIVAATMLMAEADAADIPTSFEAVSVLACPKISSGVLAWKVVPSLHFQASPSCQTT